MRRKRINNVLYRLPADDREALMAALDGVIIYSTYKGRPVMLVPDDYRWYGSTEVKHKSHRWGRSMRVHPERFGIAYIRCADPEVSELIPLQGVTFEQVIDRVSESLEKSGVSRDEFEFIISK